MKKTLRNATLALGAVAILSLGGCYGSGYSGSYGYNTNYDSDAGLYGGDYSDAGGCWHCGMHFSDHGDAWHHFGGPFSNHSGFGHGGLGHGVGGRAGPSGFGGGHFGGGVGHGGGHGMGGHGAR